MKLLANLINHSNLPLSRLKDGFEEQITAKNIVDSSDSFSVLFENIEISLSPQTFKEDAFELSYISNAVIPIWEIMALLIRGKGKSYIRTLKLKELESFSRDKNHIPVFSYDAEDEEKFEKLKTSLIENLVFCLGDLSKFRSTEKMNLAQKSQVLLGALEQWQNQVPEANLMKLRVISLRKHELKLVSLGKINSTQRETLGRFLAKNLFLEEKNVIFE